MHLAAFQRKRVGPFNTEQLAIRPPQQAAQSLLVRRGKDDHPCSLTRRKPAIVVVVVIESDKCAAKLDDCCPAGESLCGSVCCGPPKTCMAGNMCKEPVVVPGPDGGP